jgi:hypothetical protein
MTMGTRTHFCIGVKDVLARGQAYCGTLGLRRLDGTKASAEEVQDWLLDEALKGRAVVPAGECDNFDYQKGCLGHD